LNGLYFGPFHFWLPGTPGPFPLVGLYGMALILELAFFAILLKRFPLNVVVVVFRGVRNGALETFRLETCVLVPTLDVVFLLIVVFREVRNGAPETFRL
jgi:hypothetical protein